VLLLHDAHSLLYVRRRSAQLGVYRVTRGALLRLCWGTLTASGGVRSVGARGQFCLATLMLHMPESADDCWSRSHGKVAA
jgi:hypothetical protein